MSVLFIFQTVLQWMLIAKGHYSWISIVSAVISTVAFSKGVYSIMKACFCPENSRHQFGVHHSCIVKVWLGNGLIMSESSQNLRGELKKSELASELIALVLEQL